MKDILAIIVMTKPAQVLATLRISLMPLFARVDRRKNIITRMSTSSPCCYVADWHTRERLATVLLLAPAISKFSALAAVVLSTMKSTRITILIGSFKYGRYRNK